MEASETQIIAFFSNFALPSLQKGLDLLKKTLQDFDYQLRFKNNQKVFQAIQQLIQQDSPLIYYLYNVKTQQEYDGWNMFIQSFLQVIGELIEMAEDFDIEALTSYFMADLISFSSSLHQDSFLCTLTKKSFFKLLQRGQDMAKVLATYSSRYFNPTQPTKQTILSSSLLKVYCSLIQVSNSVTLLLQIIKTETSLFFDKKIRHLVVRLFEHMVVRYHYLSQKTNPQNVEFVNNVKLLMVELVNVYVDDMIRIIRSMNEKNKALLIELIESLDQSPPTQFSRSKLNSSRGSRQSNTERSGFGRQSVLQSSGSAILGLNSNQNLFTDKQEDQLIHNRNYSTNLVFHTAQPTPKSSDSIIYSMSEDDLFKLIVVNFEDGLQQMNDMINQTYQFKDLNKIMQVILKNMFQFGFSDTNPQQVDSIFKTLGLLSESKQNGLLLQSMLPQLMNAYFQLPLLSQHIEKLIMKTIYNSSGSAQDDLLKVLVHYLNKKNQLFLIPILNMIIIFLLKPSMHQQSLSKEVLEVLIDTVIDVLINFQGQILIKALCIDIIITVLTNIEEQMEHRLEGQLDKQLIDDLIKHKVAFKMVPFIDYKKSMIVLSSGDPIKLPDGLFQENQVKQTEQPVKNIKSFDFVIKNNDMIKVNKQDSAVNQYMLNKVQSMQSLQQSQYSNKKLMDKGPPHFRMQRYAPILEKKSMHGPLKGFSAQEWDKAFDL